jgi:hypothetical protein
MSSNRYLTSSPATQHAVSARTSFLSTPAPLISRGLRKFPALAQKTSIPTFTSQVPAFTIFTARQCGPGRTVKNFNPPPLTLNSRNPSQLPAITNSNHLQPAPVRRTYPNANTLSLQKNTLPLFGRASVPSFPSVKPHFCVVFTQPKYRRTTLSRQNRPSPNPRGTARFSFCTANSNFSFSQHSRHSVPPEKPSLPNSFRFSFAYHLKLTTYHSLYDSASVALQSTP